MINLSLALLTAALLVLAFPRFDLTFLAAVALAPLLVAATHQRSVWRRFLLGEAAGIIYWFGVTYWIQSVLEIYGGMGRVGSWGAFLLFAVLKAVHLGVFTALAGYLMPKPYAIPAVAALWVVIERTHGPLGFAWLALGDAGTDMGLPMRMAPLAGVYGVSFVFAMMSVAVALVLMRRPRRELVWVGALLGLYLLPALPDPMPGTESAAVVQPDFSEDEHWTTQSVDAAQQTLLRLSMRSALSANEPAVRMILWPEMPLPLYYEEDERFREQAEVLARSARTSLLFGAVAHTPDRAPLNSAILLDARGNFAGRYDKMFLVPFGEYVPPPFGFVNRITSEAGDFVPGRKLVVMPVDGRRVGVFICYESAFPYLVRQFTASGAEVLVNLSNDGYFGASAAREQHLKLVRMRAAENRRWLVRATNSGISATIDPAGRITHRLPEYAQTAVRTRYSYLKGMTPYTRYGDWFVWVCAVIAAAALALTQVPKYRRES
jgi:apolipoprotein N-acyltransferase